MQSLRHAFLSKNVAEATKSEADIGALMAATELRAGHSRGLPDETVGDVVMRFLQGGDWWSSKGIAREIGQQVDAVRSGMAPLIKRGKIQKVSVFDYDKNVRIYLYAVPGQPKPASKVKSLSNV